jgi:transposase
MWRRCSGWCVRLPPSVPPLSEAQAEIERLQLIVQKLQRNQFGRRAERLDDGQLHLFAFRGRRADTVKILFWDGNGLCLFTKRLQQGRFIWPSLREPGGTVTLTPAQLAMLIEGIDWRTPERTWKPSLAG